MVSYHVQRNNSIIYLYSIVAVTIDSSMLQVRCFGLVLMILLYKLFYYYCNFVDTYYAITFVRE